MIRISLFFNIAEVSIISSKGWELVFSFLPPDSPVLEVQLHAVSSCWLCITNGVVCTFLLLVQRAVGGGRTFCWGTDSACGWSMVHEVLCSANVSGCTKRFALLLTQSAEVTGKAAPWVLSCQKFPERVIQPTYVCR